jgi:hypothetical protein
MSKIYNLHFFCWWKEYFFKRKICSYNSFERLLKRYNIHSRELYNTDEDDADVVFISVFGHFPNDKKLKYKNTRKVFYTGENKGINRDCDLNLTFINTSECNNIRFPVWILNLITDIPFRKDEDFFKKDYFIELSKMKLTPKNTNYFCCYLASRRMTFREDFLKKICNYKKVDSAGGTLNNVGFSIKSGFQAKANFQKDYKFAMAFENTVSDGYTTEKILHAYMSNCIPIYWGNDNVEQDFNKETMICVRDYGSIEEAIEYIKKVDNDEELYNSYMNKPIFSKTWIDRFTDPEEKFFKNVVNEIIGK